MIMNVALARSATLGFAPMPALVLWKMATFLVVTTLYLWKANSGTVLTDTAKCLACVFHLSTVRSLRPTVMLQPRLVGLAA
jgi:hypothetical protein